MNLKTQRRLLLVRHAKALEDETGGDHARRLNPRGAEDAAALGAWLAEQDLLPELVLCSSATRTRETLGIICEALAYPSPLAGEARWGGGDVGEHALNNAAPSPRPSPARGKGVINIPTILREKLYLANASDMLAQIQGADDAVTSLMLIGHNPGMHGLLALLTGEYRDEKDSDRVIMKFPTAACAVLSFEVEQWRDLAPHSGLLETLRWPVDG